MMDYVLEALRLSWNGKRDESLSRALHCCRTSGLLSLILSLECYSAKKRSSAMRRGQQRKTARMTLSGAATPARPQHWTRRQND